MRLSRGFACRSPKVSSLAGSLCAAMALMQVERSSAGWTAAAGKRAKASRSPAGVWTARKASRPHPSAATPMRKRSTRPILQPRQVYVHAHRLGRALLQYSLKLNGTLLDAFDGPFQLFLANATTQLSSTDRQRTW